MPVRHGENRDTRKGSDVFRKSENSYLSLKSQREETYETVLKLERAYGTKGQESNPKQLRECY